MLSTAQPPFFLSKTPFSLSKFTQKHRFPYQNSLKNTVFPIKIASKTPLFASNSLKNAVFRLKFPQNHRFSPQMRAKTPFSASNALKNTAFRLKFPQKHRFSPQMHSKPPLFASNALKNTVFPIKIPSKTPFSLSKSPQKYRFSPQIPSKTPFPLSKSPQKRRFSPQISSKSPFFTSNSLKNAVFRLKTPQLLQEEAPRAAGRAAGLLEAAVAQRRVRRREARLHCAQGGALQRAVRGRPGRGAGVVWAGRQGVGGFEAVIGVLLDARECGGHFGVRMVAGASF
jgi:hypothetical protein